MDQKKKNNEMVIRVCSEVLDICEENRHDIDKMCSIITTHMQNICLGTGENEKIEVNGLINKLMSCNMALVHTLGAIMHKLIRIENRLDGEEEKDDCLFQ